MSSDVFDRSLWIIGNRKTLPVEAIWSWFDYSGVPNETVISFRSSEAKPRELLSADLEETLESSHLPSFEVTGTGFSFQYGQNGGQNYDSVFIDGMSSLLTEEFCDELVKETIGKDENFLQAHLIDKKYQHLQNIFDPLQFKALGLSMDGLPMKSNGLPFPLEQKIVDTSQNPGRFVLGQGYVEVAAAVMWFGQKFWGKVNNTAQKAIELLPSDVTLEHDVCWKLQSCTGPFVDQSTAEIQNQIRKALFGQTA